MYNLISKAPNLEVWNTRTSDVYDVLDQHWKPERREKYSVTSFALRIWCIFHKEDTKKQGVEICGSQEEEFFLEKLTGNTFIGNLHTNSPLYPICLMEIKIRLFLLKTHGQKFVDDNANYYSRDFSYMFGSCTQDIPVLKSALTWFRKGAHYFALIIFFISILDGVGRRKRIHSRIPIFKFRQNDWSWWISTQRKEIWIHCWWYNVCWWLLWRYNVLEFFRHPA